INSWRLTPVSGSSSASKPISRLVGQSQLNLTNTVVASSFLTSAVLGQGKRKSRDGSGACPGGKGSSGGDDACHGPVDASRSAFQDSKRVGIADRGPGEIRDVCFHGNRTL